MTDSQPIDSVLAELSDEARRIEEDATYSSKRHFEAHDIWSRRHLIVGIPAVVLSVLAGANVVADAWPKANALFALVVAILTALLTFLKPSEKAAAHKAAGDQYLTLRNDARLFRNIELATGKPIDDLRGDLKTLAKRRNEINAASAQTPSAAFTRARRGIEDGEAHYAIDREAPSDRQ